MKFSIICTLFFVLSCHSRHTSAYRPNSYEYYYPEYDYIETEHQSGGNGLFSSLGDYWKVFRDTFKQSYKDLNRPYVIEREVPVYIPVDRVRTVVKHHPVFIKQNTRPNGPNRPNSYYRRRPHYRRY